MDDQEPTWQHQMQAVAELAVDRHVRNGDVVGIGSGAVTALSAAYMAKLIDRGSLQNIQVVPASAVAAQEAAFNGLHITELQDHLQVNVTLHDVDKIDRECLASVYGVESDPKQPQLLQLQALLRKSKDFVALVDGPDRVVPRLCGNLPVLVSGGTWEDTAEALDDLVVGDAEIWRRSNSPTSSARADDDPYQNENGDNLLDIRFRVPLKDPQEDETFKLHGEENPYEGLEAAISDVDGVLSHGLLLGVTFAIVVSDKGPLSLSRVPTSV